MGKCPMQFQIRASSSSYLFTQPSAPTAPHQFDGLTQLFFGLRRIALLFEEFGVEGVIPGQIPGHPVLFIRLDGLPDPGLGLIHVVIVDIKINFSHGLSRRSLEILLFLFPAGQNSAPHRAPD